VPLIIPPEILLEAYSKGIFPMAESREAEDVEWYTAHRRGIMPLDQFRVSKNVQREIRKGIYECRVDTEFKTVMEACADRDSTWINDIILNSYQLMHQMGYAHSVEVFVNDELAGGLYGVSLGAAFFGESMFRYRKECDKIALYFCHQILVEQGFELWDTQFYTEHLGRFGCMEIEAAEYEERLASALNKECVFKL
jgi:leucyl/phenylalanyl-tRNA--protein transferase